jgi:hypothetical protein
MWMLALAEPAAAVTADRLGGYVDYGVGPALGRGLGTSLGVGVWRGKYDDELSFGRFWSLGLAVSQGWDPDAIATSWMLEARRGLDLIVVGVHGFAAAGPMLLGDEPGLSARVGGALELRRTSTLGLAVRVEGGVDAVGGDARPAFLVTLGVQTVFLRDPR